MGDSPGRWQLKGLTISTQYCDREGKAAPGAAQPWFYWMRIYDFAVANNIC